MTRLKLNVGDLFRFGSPTEGWAYGQILIADILQYVVIFEPRFGDDTDPRAVVTSRPLFHGWTADARFLSGDWQKMGNAPLVLQLAFPEYKIEKAGKIWVTNVMGNLLRPATREEALTLSFRASHSPIAFEKAFKAHYGEGPWESRFERLLFKPGQVVAARAH